VVGLTEETTVIVYISGLQPGIRDFLRGGGIMIKHRMSGRMCVLMVRVPGYRSRGPGLIPGASRPSEK
jgi:hypothetical protein